MYMKKGLVQQIKTLDVKVYEGYVFDQDDIAFLLDCLINENVDDVYIAALIALLENENNVIDAFLEAYLTIQSKARYLAIPFLGCTDYFRSYFFMLERLKVSADHQEVEIIIATLASTHFAVIPFVVESLIDDNDMFVERLKQILKKIGLKGLTSYLMLVPQIPHETVFRDIFGVEKIERIKQKK